MSEKTDITPAMETQAPVTTPAQDIFSACAELAAFSGHVTTDQWDTLRRVIATLRGVADEIGGLVRPDAMEMPLPGQDYRCLAEEACDGVEDAWETAPVVEASSPEEAAGLAITDRLPEIGLARFETDTFGEAIIFVKGVTGRVHSFRVEYLCLPHVLKVEDMTTSFAR